MQPNASAVLNLPASYSTFLYVLDGQVFIGEEKKLLDHDQVGWLDRSKEEGESELILTTKESGTRFVLYCGQPHGEKIVPHGPFIGETTEDLPQLYQEFRAGKMQHITTVAASQSYLW